MTMFSKMFQPMPGDTKAFLVENMEKLLIELKKWVKYGLEHDPEQCMKARRTRMVIAERNTMKSESSFAIDIVKAASSHTDVEFKGGWISPKTNTCDRCGFYPGSIKEIAFEYEALLGALKDLPDSYRYRDNS